MLKRVFFDAMAYFGIFTLYDHVAYALVNGEFIYDVKGDFVPFFILLAIIIIYKHEFSASANSKKQS